MYGAYPFSRTFADHECNINESSEPDRLRDHSSWEREINVRKRQGEQIYNLTIGDFDPKIFPIPAALQHSIIKAQEAGETNHPPADGMPELKDAFPFSC